MEHLKIENVEDGEIIYQRCLLVIGSCDPAATKENFITVRLSSPSGKVLFPPQNWPVGNGQFKSLVILSPGQNVINFERPGPDGVDTKSISVTYTPLLDVPPLHLAILISKDSPLTISCPPTKGSAISSAHSDLSAAIAKFRMTAYMWQAVLAENMRFKGLGRRSFRLEEEWTHDTLSSDFIDLGACNDGDRFMRTTARINLVKTEKTTREIRAYNGNHWFPDSAKAGVTHIFEEALKASDSSLSVPGAVVAGIVLDSHYSRETGQVAGPASINAYNPQGISMSIESSEFLHSWPRFLEEVPACLLDPKPGLQHYTPLWTNCCQSQFEFLMNTCLAFSNSYNHEKIAANRIGWRSYFLPDVIGSTEILGKGIRAKAAYEFVPNGLAASLRMRQRPHFALPTDGPSDKRFATAVPTVRIERDDDDVYGVVVECAAGLAEIALNWATVSPVSIQTPAERFRLSIQDLEKFDRKDPLDFHAIGINGMELKLTNLWELFGEPTYIKIPKSSIVLTKRSFKGGQNTNNGQTWTWTVLLNKPGPKNTSIDSRVGCLLDGAKIHFMDKEVIPCGPRWNAYGIDHEFGGHLSEKLIIPPRTEIAKVELARSSGQLNGLRFTLSNGSAAGSLGHGHHPLREIITLEPGSNEKIIGFSGKSSWIGFCGIIEFGIITAPRNAQIPENAYQMPELQNINGGTGERPKANTSRQLFKNEDEDKGDE